MSTVTCTSVMRDLGSTSGAVSAVNPPPTCDALLNLRVQSARKESSVDNANSVLLDGLVSWLVWRRAGLPLTDRSNQRNRSRFNTATQTDLLFKEIPDKFAVVASAVEIHMTAIPCARDRVTSVVDASLH